MNKNWHWKFFSAAPLCTETFALCKTGTFSPMKVKKTYLGLNASRVCLLSLPMTFNAPNMTNSWSNFSHNSLKPPLPWPAKESFLSVIERIRKRPKTRYRKETSKEKWMKRSGGERKKSERSGGERRNEWGERSWKGGKMKNKTSKNQIMNTLNNNTDLLIQIDTNYSRISGQTYLSMLEQGLGQMHQYHDLPFLNKFDWK